jgi:signal transduction histidine kinase
MPPSLIILSVAAGLLLVVMIVGIRRMARAGAPHPSPSQSHDPSLQSIIDALPHPVAILSPDFIIRTANAAAVRLFGLAPGAGAAGLPHKWLLPLLEEARNSRQRVAPADHGAGIQIFSDSREMLFVPQTVPLIAAEGGRLAGIALILIDATGTRQVNEAKSGLLSLVSHELKTPLTSLQMAIHLLADDPATRLSLRERELLLTARDDADRLNQLIDDLLDVGRLRSGKAPLQVESLPPATILESATQSLLREFAEKHVELRDELPPELPHVRADAGRAAYVLAALLTAARRAAREGAAIVVAGVVDGPRFTFFIRLAHEAIDPLFSHPRSAAGRDGLSLAVAREIAAAHEGGIESTSTPAGLEWAFTLPLA